MNTPEKGFVRLRKKAFPKFLRENFGRKLAALLLALLIHGVVKDKYFSEERPFVVPVDIVLPQGICNTARSTPAVTVILRGSSSALARLSSGDIKIKGTLDRDDFHNGVPTRIQLQKSWLDLPDDVRFDRFEPAVLTLEHLEEEVRKEVPVVASWLGGENSEYGYSTVFMPAFVAVTGPGSLVNNIEKVTTEPLVVPREIGETHFNAVRLSVPANVNLSTKEVIATVFVSRQTQTKNFSDLPVFVLMDNDDRNKNVSFPDGSNVTVILSGAYSDLQGISAAQLRPCLDISRLDEPGEYETAVFVTPPANTKVESIYPENIKVQISFKDGADGI